MFGGNNQMEYNRKKPILKKLDQSISISKEKELKEQKDLKRKLKESEECFEILYEYTPDLYYLSDIKGTFMDCNQAAEKITGYKREELIGKNFFKSDILTKEDFLKTKKVLKKNQEDLLADPEEYTLKCKDGKTIEVEITTYPVKIKEKRFVLSIVRDTTQQKEITKALVEGEKKYKTLINQAPEALSLHDLEGNIIEVNKAMVDWYGYCQDELLKLKIEDIDPDSVQRGDRNHYWKKLEENKIVCFETRHRRKDGSFFPVRVSLSAIRLGDSKYFLGLAEDITAIKNSQQKIEKTMNAIIETISRIVEIRDPYTAGHQERVAQLSTRIARELGLSGEEIEAIRIASLLHDIGKIGIPSEILNKPCKLSEIEFGLIKAHPQTGYNILKSIDFPYPIAQIILQHHERNDGSGYPNHLKSDQILLEAKIIGVADVIESMCSHRPYRPNLGIEKALTEINLNQGVLYEPEVVNACIVLFEKKGFQFMSVGNK